MSSTVLEPYLSSVLGLETPAILQAGLLGTQYGQLLLVIVAIAIVILIGRLVLRIAWRLVTIAAVIVGIALLLSLFGLI